MQRGMRALFVVGLYGAAWLGCSKDEPGAEPRSISYPLQPRVEELPPSTRPPELASGDASRPSPVDASVPTDAGTSDADARADAADAGPPRAFGVACTSDDQCESTFCLATGICSKPCGTSSDCLAGPEWSCMTVPAIGKRCMCISTGADVCGDSRDNDCTGFVDDACVGAP